MTTPWTSENEPVHGTLPRGLVTLIEGTSFCISTASGDITPSGTQGLFVRDTRVLSQWSLTFDGAVPAALHVEQVEPHEATYLARIPTTPGFGDTPLLMVRRRRVGRGMRERITVRNLGSARVAGVLRLALGADFADLFEVKDGRVGDGDRTTSALARDSVTMSGSRGAHLPGVQVSADGSPLVSDSQLAWHLELEGGTERTVTVDVNAVIGDLRLPMATREDSSTRHPTSGPGDAWRRTIPRLTSADPALCALVERSIEDLDALRIVDDLHPDRTVVAAGAPWFMALFGRDSILTSWMTLPLDPTMAADTLRTLADHQGARTDPATEEQPGRILHEVRFGLTAADLALGGGRVYYGTADASGLFVMLIGELARWGGDPALVSQLLPHADRALHWITETADGDEDGFAEYDRATDQGLVNQGWKDSWDGISFADGRLPSGPIALAEVQAYTYAALVARADLAGSAGDEDGRRRWSAEAVHLKERFNEAFWMPGQGYFAVALDGEKRQVDSLTSNIGHCLWTGIIDDDKAAAVADHLLSPALFSGWGIRTLATHMARYNPMSYHNGSVWPHDNALCVAGLVRYGFVGHAHRVITGLLAAADHFGQRLPELFSGFDRDEFSFPVPYPTSCSPQAWAAAAPLSLLRSMLRLAPDFPSGRIVSAPIVPERYLPLTWHGLRLGGLSLDVEVPVDGSTRGSAGSTSCLGGDPAGRSEGPDAAATWSDDGGSWAPPSPRAARWELP